MTKLRFASPNEQRTISREDCGFYNAVAIGAIYEFSGSSVDVRSSRSFYGALIRCVHENPVLSVVVRDMHTDASYFERVPTLNLEDHISIVREADINAALALKERVGSNDDELTRIETLLHSIVDRPWPSSPPPWRIVVLPLSPSRDRGTEHTRCFVAFSFSHALGDGITALTFHRTFQAGFFDPVKDDCSALSSPVAEFPAPFDTPKNLPISWGFLLRPLLAVLLPKSITDALGLRATASVAGPDTWTGSRTFFDRGSYTSRLRLFEIPGSEVEHAQRVARRHGAKLTATIHGCVVRALSRALPRDNDAATTTTTNFVSGTAVNMRGAVGQSNDAIGLFVNAWYEVHERDDAWASPWSEAAWARARSLTEKLAACAVTLHDQPVGLLRYAPSIRAWTAAKIGKQRDCSYELSNLGSFEAGAPPARDPVGGDDDRQCEITKMVFSRPADATSSPITFSVVSVRGGSMVVSIAWQPGSCGMPLDAEARFIDELGVFLKEDLKNLR